MESKIARFRLVIAEKSNSEVGGNFSNREEHKLKLKAKLNEIKILNKKLVIHDNRLEEKLVF